MKIMNPNFVDVDDDELIREISHAYSPDEVYSGEELDNWAISNGYVKE